MKHSLSTNLDDINFEEFLHRGFIFQRPNSNVAWLGVLDEGTSTNYIVYHSNFYQSKQQFFNTSKLFKVELSLLQKKIHKHLSLKVQLELITTEDDNYLADVHLAIKKIKSNSMLKKLVTVSRSTYNKLQTHPISNLRELARLEGYIYGIWGNEVNNVLGVTPEPLFVKNGEEFLSVALAGTISSEINEYKNKIMADEKELNEHQLVVDDIKSKLGACVTDFRTEEIQVRPFGKIAHLETPIAFNSQKDALDIVMSMSPTAALGGYPTDTALRELKDFNYFKYSKDDRSFGGVYGFKLEAIEYALVGIRNIYWSESKAWIHSGGGIVSSSVPEKELDEIQRKRQSIEEVFGGE